MIKMTCACAGLLSASLVLSAADYTIHTFKKIQLSREFWGEGAHFGDFNRDGHMDVVSGPYWYEGPEFKKRHEYYPATHVTKRTTKDGKEETFPGFSGALGDKNDYSDNFFAFTHDLNGDGWTDILIYGFPGLDASWYENPRGREGNWVRHKVLDVVDNESPTWCDLTGDGKPEIVCNSGGYFGYASPDWAHPEVPWVFHRISPKGGWQRFTHGLGVGDVNGDGRQDILDKDGWWEQPASLQGDPEWKRHQANFGSGGSQMFAYDVNGDGLNDVITSLAAHGYGLTWFEQYRENGQAQFRAHTFVNKEAKENKYGVHFSQPHAMDLIDIDGDGLKDLVTGKRFWAHGPEGDPEPNAPALLYWFQLVRGPDKSVDFVPHLIDDDSGVGTQVVAGDVTGDGRPDVVVGNKKGTFVHVQEVKKVSREEWEKAQPKPLSVAAASAPTPAASGNQPQGILPVGREGKPLNLDFEDGTLKDWTASGDAFDKQPVEGDVVHGRRGDMTSHHAGHYWVGTYEVHQDAAKGTLTSAPFKVTQPYAAFLIAGGPYENTRVELVRADSGKVLFKISGFDGEVFKKSNDATEVLHPVVVDLKAQQGKEIFVRVVDQQDGHWGHINFDDFKLYAAKPVFPDALDPKQKPVPAEPPLDVVKFAGLSPEAAAREMTLPPGFSATAFAAEPDVKQPIAFAIDDRGRLWVAEAYTYPVKAPAGQGKDRILIFEDTDGDGKFDRRTVFIEHLNLVSGLEVGFGGVWVGAAPDLLFIPDANGDDKPDGEPQVVLDGWAWQDTHETLNTFTWGPDGWLYGCHGVFTHSKVGKPGTPSEERTKINAGVWRYHPQKKIFEVFAEGTSNPWGIDFDEHGQCIIEACVIPHLYHMIQGGRFQRQAGQAFNPYTYDDIKTIADHVHYAGSRGPHAGNSRSAAVGGGHAHAGLLVYQGDSWPEQYRGKYFMNNIHGERINMDIPVRQGSGFVGKHGPDLINFNDRWSQILNLLMDQNGSVYMIDWYDQNQCHHANYEGHDRSNGRIFKIIYNHQPWTPVDLRSKSDDELVQMQLTGNEWYVRHARRLLQERGGNDAVRAALWKIVTGPAQPERRLRALWALHVTGGIEESQGLTLLKDSNEYIRAWTIQLLAEDRSVSQPLRSEWARLAKEDSSPVVRLYLASALQRLRLEQRPPILAGLLSHAEDAQDHNLPLMYWYAAEPVAGESAAQAVALLGKTKIPVVRQYIAKRMSASSNKKTAALR
jgi:putative membrane-bound dehydrogenase-like protein